MANQTEELGNLAKELQIFIPIVAFILGLFAGRFTNWAIRIHSIIYRVWEAVKLNFEMVILPRKPPRKPPDKICSNGRSWSKLVGTLLLLYWISLNCFDLTHSILEATNSNQIVSNLSIQAPSFSMVLQNRTAKSARSNNSANRAKAGAKMAKTGGSFGGPAMSNHSR